MNEVIYTADELARVHALHAPGYWNLALSTPYWFLVFAAMLRFGVRPIYVLSVREAAALGRHLPPSRVLERLWGGPGAGTAILFAINVALVFFASGLPGSVFFDFVQPHRYGLSNETLAHYFRTTAVDLAGTVLVSACLALGLFGLIRRARRWWLLLGAVSAVLLLFSAALDPYVAQLNVKHTPLPGGPLRTMLLDTMARANLEVRDISVEKASDFTEKVGASFAGQGPSRRIVLSDTLVAKLTPPEILAAVAHEAGHVQESRWPGRLLASAALLLFLFCADRLFSQAASRHWFGSESRSDIRLLPLMSALFALLVTLGSPLSAAYTRSREAAADRFAISLTHDPSAFRSMLIHATRINLMDPDPPRWAAFMFDHPSIRERLAAIPAR